MRRATIHQRIEDYSWRVEYCLDGKWHLMNPHLKGTTLEKAIKKMLGNHWAIAHDMVLSVHNNLTNERIPLEAIGITEEMAKTITSLRDFQRYAAFDVNSLWSTLRTMRKEKISFDIETRAIHKCLFQNYYTAP